MKKSLPPKPPEKTELEKMIDENAELKRQLAAAQELNKAAQISINRMSQAIVKGFLAAHGV